MTIKFPSDLAGSEATAQKRTGFPSDLFEAEIRRLVAERPSFVYEEPEFISAYGESISKGCVYKDAEGNGSCLLGHALVNLGIDIPEQYNADTAWNDLVDKMGWDVDPLVRYWARNVQNAQDDEKPWGDSVRRADALTNIIYGKGD